VKSLWVEPGELSLGFFEEKGDMLVLFLYVCLQRLDYLLCTVGSGDDETSEYVAWYMDL